MIHAMFRPTIVFFVLCALAACGPGRLPDQVAVTLTSDGETQALTLPQGQTVRDALKAASLNLGELDRVRPPETTLLTSGMGITVTRIVQTTETVTQTLPFETQTVRDASVPSGERRLQAGRNGTLQITYRITYEDGRQVKRDEISRDVIELPTPEILLVGIKGAFSTVPLSGTIVYLSNNNAFVMRDVSGNRRPLTTAGDLDGRVLSLSADGRWLLYTRSTTSTLNSLRLIDTTLARPEPNELKINGVLWADFSPDGKSIAYSRADPAPGLPGWKAYNDLQMVTFNNGRIGSRREIVAQSSNAPYAWWGTSFAWSPDSKQLAFATTDALGVISPTARLTKTIRLLSYAAYDTRSTWAWTPTPSWSPGGRFLVSTVHVPSTTGESPEDSPAFSVAALAVSGTLQAGLIDDAGMWAAPQWLPGDLESSKIAFGVADTPYASETAYYTLYMMDRDGSNRTRLFPIDDSVGLQGLPDFAPAPDGRSLLVVYQGDLYLINLTANSVRRLTAEGTISKPRWSK
jgi:Tol biopolymer transport system component